jgi:membrane protein DedA with SNARE-associated domain
MRDDALAGPVGGLADGTAGEMPHRRIVLDMPSWVPSERIPRRLLTGLLILVLILALVGTALPFATGWVGESDFEEFGYAGIFIANFLGTVTGFLPVPGLTAGGQALIVAGSQTLFVPAVVVVGASAMTLGESTAYLTGAVGRGILEEREMPLKGRAGQVMSRMASWVDWMMARYGCLTLLVLSAIPNPFFEFAGITAGAVRMNFWRFMLAVGIGKTIRVILLVIIGDALLDAFEIDIG